jgi:glycine/D-amino acid oxidase-like deaminating enzyme
MSAGPRVRVGVLGGGLQGCCTALALAERGAKVVLIDRNCGLLSRTAIANEGKIHLGYMYAADPTFATARTMMQGALAFAPFMRRYLGSVDQALRTSKPATYVVHRDSQHGVAAVTAYLAEVHRLLVDSARGRQHDYFGLDLSAPPRAWSADERDAAFNPQAALAAFDTPEIAINPGTLADALRARIAGHPRIELCLGQHVLKAEAAASGVRVTSQGSDGPATDGFDHVVNALWDGRLAVDGTMGLRPARPWLHRLKYGVSFTVPPGLERPPSATFVSGPFGEVVSYADRLTYLTWYPECLHGLSAEVTPPAWDTYPPEPLRSQILHRTIAAMANMVPSLAAIDPAGLTDASVKGGVIVAWGETDIYDPESALHRRYEIGVTSVGRYHSIDPGKLTMAPYFAERCAERIYGLA